MSDWRDDSQDLRPTPWPASLLWLPAIAVVIYLGSSIGFAFTKAPLNDEGWFAAPAFNLATHGTLGILALEPTGSWLSADLTGIRQHTYWNMPLCMVIQAAWFRLTGFGLVPMRLLSILAGLVVLGSWFVIVRSLTQDRVAASLASFLLAIDYTFLWGAADGRPDMLCLAFGSLALASYLKLRESNLNAAILISHTFGAAGIFTHPNGLMAIIALTFLTVYLDAKRLRIQHVLAGIPYVIGMIGWFCYISEAPSQFLAQFAANSSVRGGTRTAFLVHPLRTLYLEVLFRYGGHFGLYQLWTDATSHWNILIPLVYWASLISAAFSGVRKHNGRKALILFGLLYFALSTANGIKLQFYLVYLMPVYAAVLALWTRYMLQRPAIVFVPVLLVPLLYLQGSSIVQLTRADKYHKTYLPAMQYVKQIAGPDSTITGNSTAAFALGYDNLVDDERIGYFSSVVPDILISDRFYPVFWRGFDSDRPDVGGYVSILLKSQFEPVFRNEYYTIYRRHVHP